MSFHVQIDYDTTEAMRNERCVSRESRGQCIKVWSRQAIAAAMADLERAALEAGWRRVHAGWVCPECAPPRRLLKPRRLAR
jgi:hypothetical protein